MAATPARATYARFSAAPNGCLYVAVGGDSLYGYAADLESKREKIDLGPHGIIADVLFDQVDIGKGTIDDILWLADSSQGVIRVAKLNKNSLAPGPAELAPVHHLNQGRALFHDPVSFSRLTRPTLVILDSLAAGGVAVHLLDLRTWNLTTICDAWGDFAPEARPHLYPWSVHAPFYADNAEVSDSLVQLYSPGLGAHHVTIETGAIAVGGRKNGPTKLVVLPSGLNPISPYWIVDSTGICYMWRRKGNNLEQFVLPEIAESAGHVPSTGLTVIFRKGALKKVTVSWSNRNTVYLPRQDLSSYFIDSTVLPTDLTLTHPSGKTWKLDQDILSRLHPSLRLETLQRVVEETKLLPESVHAFLCCLLHYDHQWDPTDRRWFHVIHLCKEVGLRTLEDYLSSYFASIVRDEDLCSTLIGASDDELSNFSHKDPIILHLANRVSHLCSEAFTELAADQPSRKNTLLVALVANVKLPPTESYEPSPPGIRATYVQCEPIPLEDDGVTFKPATALLRKPTDFVLSLEDLNIAIVADMRILYIGWYYFQDMMSAGMTERKERHAVMPPWMTEKTLQSVIQCLHSTKHTAMSMEDGYLLLEHRKELRLVDSTTEVPYPRFKLLIQSLLRNHFSELNAANCIAQLAKYDRLRMDPKVEDVLDFIKRTKVPCDVAELMKTLPLSALARLHAKLNEE